jgi:hypothetical protein
MSDNPPLTEAERIALVQADRERRIIQIILAVVLIASAIGYLFYYTLFLADVEFQHTVAQAMLVLIIMGTGAGLAIFGLGRTVGK